MNIPYEIGQIVKINFKIESISIGKNYLSISLIHENKGKGVVINYPLINEEQLKTIMGE